MHQTDIQGDTALMRIIKSSCGEEVRYMSARILASSHAGASRLGDKLHRSLQMTVSLGDADMCRLLICDGKADPHSVLIRGDDGQLVLKDQPRRNEETILKMLQTHTTCNQAGRSREPENPQSEC